MSKRGLGIPLGERVRPDQRPPRPVSAERVHPPAAPVHCWVVNPTRYPGTWPGLIVARHQDSNGTWWADVTFAVQEPPEPAFVVTTRLPFWQLRPVDIPLR